VEYHVTRIEDGSVVGWPCPFADKERWIVVQTVAKCAMLDSQVAKMEQLTVSNDNRRMIKSSSHKRWKLNRSRRATQEGKKWLKVGKKEEKSASCLSNFLGNGKVRGLWLENKKSHIRREHRLKFPLSPSQSSDVQARPLVWFALFTYIFLFLLHSFLPHT
jgi:hypothetical protein